MAMGRAHLLPLVLLAACGKQTIEVATKESVSDYRHGALVAAVDTYVKAGRTPDAFAQLAHTALELRPKMDRYVGEEAERKLIVLALEPVRSVAAKSRAEQIDALALTVWPLLLAPPIAADQIMVQRDPKADELMPKQGETTAVYLERLCGGPLAGDCKDVVPEYQGLVVGALATRRAMERVRNAVASCLPCSSEHGWHEAVHGWEAQDQLVNLWIHDVERRADPANWPIAGTAAEVIADLPEAEIDAVGEVMIGGQRYAGTDRVAALKDLRGEHDAIAMHLRPELTLAQVKALLADAKASGATKIAVVARTPAYPWQRKVYWLSDAGTTRAGLRLTDTLQMLLHTIDHVAGPGAIARVD